MLQVGEHFGGIDGPDVDSTVLADGWVRAPPLMITHVDTFG